MRGSFWPSEEIEGGHLEGEEIEGGHPGQVRRFMGVILEGEEIERGYTRWPKATHRAEGPQLAKRACPPRRGLEGEPRSGSNF